ncbi:B12-binding domain-containing radical SAM protein [Thermodesulfobacteriota bacterium]
MIFINQSGGKPTDSHNPAREVTSKSDDPGRILLIYPPSRTQVHSSCPVGMMMLAAVLENANYKVHLLDANAKGKIRSSEEIIRIARELQPDIIGITLLTPLVKEAYRLASKLKGLGKKLMAGGPHATLLPEEPLAYGFDAVVVGEGEPTIIDAVKALGGLLPKEDVPGWVYRDENGRPRHTKPKPMVSHLDNLPLPARHLVNPLDYGPVTNSALYGNLFSSRGCPAKCAYCAGNLFGKRFRFRSAQSVLEEIQQVHDTYGVEHFHFVDDAMTMDKNRVKQICQGLLQADINITWSMMTRIDTVNRELLELVAEAGCVQIDYGVESGHPDTLKRIHKPHTVEMVKNIIPLTAELGIRPYVFFILGFPWEGPDEIEETQSLMFELSAYVDNFHPALASILIPFPGTEIYEKHKDQYGFENWWLSSDRSYDAPSLKKHAYYESIMFKLGSVLDADFFHYTPEVKERIYDVFKFMYLHNSYKSSRISRLIHRSIFELSEILSVFSPTLERMIFKPLIKTRQILS